MSESINTKQVAFIVGSDEHFVSVAQPLLDSADKDEDRVCAVWMWKRLCARQRLVFHSGHLSRVESRGCVQTDNMFQTNTPEAFQRGICLHSHQDGGFSDCHRTLRDTTYIGLSLLR